MTELERMNVMTEIQQRPLITVVTVSYNAAKTIEQTILSVLNQTYPNIEYIIIDGGSTDETVDIIKKYADRLAYWVSEPDKGIYDAMNKGIDKATGDWINFMNSGDYFATCNVLLSVPFVSGYDVIYGDRYCIINKRKFLQKPSSLESFKVDFPIFHQSTFTRVELLKRSPFDLKYKICADYHSFYCLWKSKCYFKYVNVVISICDCETGVSSVMANEYQRIIENEYIKYGKKSYWFYISLIKNFCKIKIKILVDKICHDKFKAYQLKKLISNRNMYEAD